ncbi:MAG: hypothetical protein ACYC35_19465, partial [Pirellulales bacterium]
MSNSAAVFWRFTWKEYRVMRGFWLSLAVMAVLGQWIVSQWPRGDWSPATWYFGLALVVPGLYALGCGATMFALEREEATYDFLCGLPATGRRLLLGKLGLGVLSVLVMFGLLGCMASYLVEWQLPEPKVQWDLVATFGPAWAEALAWAILFSLLTSRPLSAACLAGAVIFAVVLPTSLMVGGLVCSTRDVDALEFGLYVASLPYRAALAALVLCVDFWLAKRWLPGAIGPRSTAAARLKAESPRRSGLGRLVWHHLQQSAGMMAVLGGVAVFAIGVTAIASASTSKGGLAYWQLNLWCVSTVLPSFIGSCVFLSDQSGRQFRFFAEHGARPRYVWLSRQLVWMFFLLVILVVSAAADGFALSAALPSRVNPETTVRTLTSIVGLSLVAAAVGYAAGQLASLFLRSGITATFGGLCVTAALGAWAWLMDFLGVSWAWSVMPIPFWLLWVTWLRAPDWILEHNGWKAWSRVSLSLVVPAAALVAAVPLYRVYSIPAGGPGFSVEEFARSVTAEERATAEMYRRACDLYVPPEDEGETKIVRGGVEPGTVVAPSPPAAPWPDSSSLRPGQLAWLKTNQEALATVMKATARPDCAFFDPAAAELVVKDLARLKILFSLLKSDARRCEDEGQLDQAFDRYMAALRMSRHLRQRNVSQGADIADQIEQEVGYCLVCWAARPGQTRARIGEAMLRLGELNQRLPSKADAIKADYLMTRRALRALAGEEDGATALVVLHKSGLILTDSENLGIIGGRLRGGNLRQSVKGLTQCLL